MVVIVVDVLRLAQVSHTARCFWGGVSREEASVYRHWNVAGLVPGGTNRLGGLGATLDSVESAQSRIAGLRL
jgi:hypothetical protein